jgi:hypothetical protein
LDFLKRFVGQYANANFFLPGQKDWKEQTKSEQLNESHDSEINDASCCAIVLIKLLSTQPIEFKKLKRPKPL